MLSGIVSESAQCALNREEAQHILFGSGCDGAASRRKMTAVLDVPSEGVHNERLLRAEVVLGDANRELAGG